VNFAGQMVEVGVSGLNSPVGGFVLQMTIPAYPGLGTYLGRYYLFHRENDGIEQGWLVDSQPIYHPDLFPVVTWPFVTYGSGTYLSLFVKLKYGWDVEQFFFVS